MSILLLESLHADAEAVLSAAGAVRRATDTSAPSGDLGDVRAIVTRGRGRIDEALMARCPKLQVIARAGAGLDNLDTAAAGRRGITVIYAPGANTGTVAEHTIALILDLARGITRCAREVAAGGWEQRASYTGQELRGLTLGLVGFGNIGRRVADLATAFAMNVIVATNPERRGPITTPYPRLPLDELLPIADVVSLHVPLTDATRMIIDAAAFARLKPGAFLVNTARGGLIDMAALRAALDAGRLGGFAADVLDQEPPAKDDPLLASPRVILTPHIASLTGATYRRLCLSTAENVVRVLRGDSPEPQSIFRPR